MRTSQPADTSLAAPLALVAFVALILFVALLFLGFGALLLVPMVPLGLGAAVNLLARMLASALVSITGFRPSWAGFFWLTVLLLPLAPALAGLVPLFLLVSGAVADRQLADIYLVYLLVFDNPLFLVGYYTCIPLINLPTLGEALMRAEGIIIAAQLEMWLSSLAFRLRLGRLTPSKE